MHHAAIDSNTAPFSSLHFSPARPKVAAASGAVTQGDSWLGRVTWLQLMLKMTNAKTKEGDGALPHPWSPSLSLVCNKGDRTPDSQRRS